MTFAQEVRKWRGNRLQKQVHDLFPVSISTFQKWEEGVNEPEELAKRQARLVMAADELGLRPEIYIQNYWRVIKQVAAEIQNRK